MFHAYAKRFDVTGNLENFLVFGGELNKAQQWKDNIIALSVPAGVLEQTLIGHAAPRAVRGISTVLA